MSIAITENIKQRVEALGDEKQFALVSSSTPFGVSDVTKAVRHSNYRNTQVGCAIFGRKWLLLALELKYFQKKVVK